MKSTLRPLSPTEEYVRDVQPAVSPHSSIDSIPKDRTPGWSRSNRCASCNCEELETVYEFGSIPLAGAFPTTAHCPQNAAYPLTIAICRNCLLVQVLELIDPHLLFDDYRYLSSVQLLEHFRQYAETVPQIVGLESQSLVVEVGCNDGTLLHELYARGFTNLLGIDPARNITARIDERIAVKNDFFTRSLAEQIRAERGRPSLIIANNVFAHLPDVNDFLDGIAHLLDEDGYFVFEVHSLADLISGHQFDTIYHEHRFYYSITSLVPLLQRYGLHIQQVDHISTHGGSYRIFASAKAANIEVVERELGFESSLGLDRLLAYEDFSRDIKSTISRLATHINEIPEGHQIAAYGAAGRAVTLLNCIPDAAQRISYVVDDSPERIGRHIPGVFIPVVSRAALAEQPVDTVIITAWPYKEVIIDRIRSTVTGPMPRILMPLPNPEYVE